MKFSYSKLLDLTKSKNSIHDTILHCSENSLISLPISIGNLTNLTILNCSYNNLISLPESIGLLINLTNLCCCYNQLTTLPESIGNLTNLTVLYCSKNRLTSLPDSVGLLTNLDELICEYNELIVLPKSIGNLQNLTQLYCDDNQLITLPAELGNCKNIRTLYYYNNPIEFIPVNVQRLINRIINPQDIYDNRQNVQNHDIQQSISKSIINLLNDTMQRQLSVNSTIDNILKSSLADKTKSALVEYSEDLSVHTVLNISFRELLDCVWQRIENHSNKENILRILEDEMSDAECKCFTGRMSRLVNCLNGFYDDICVEIGEKGTNR